MDRDLAGLAKEVEAALSLGDELAGRVARALEAASKGGPVSRADLDSTDRILGLIYEIRPGWAVSMKGVAALPNGHWRCSLRRSDSRDNDEYLGIGRGPTLPHSLLAALLLVMAYGR